MNKLNYLSILLVFLFCSTLMSCESSKTPLQVSEHFWLGIQKNNTALVRKYSLSDSLDESGNVDAFEGVRNIKFGKIIIDGNSAEVDTSLSIKLDEKTADMFITTYLKNEDDIWKVNYEKTVRQLEANKNVAEIMIDIQEMTEEITKEIETSVEEIKEKVVPQIQSRAEQVEQEIKEKVIPEIQSRVEQAEQEIREKLPELKTIIDEFLNELEESLDELIPEQAEPKTQQT
jgi:DNA-binding ferritin-like protein